LSHPVHATNVV